MMNILWDPVQLQIFWDGTITISIISSFFILWGLFMGMVYSEKHRKALIVGCVICCAFMYFLLAWNYIWPPLYGFP